MLIDIPECKRCAFCFPLRYGILIFGYLSLIFSILVICLELWLGYGSSVTEPTMSIYRGVGLYTQMWFPILLYILEVIFNIILLIGAHMKINEFNTSVLLLRYNNDFSCVCHVHYCQTSSFPILDLRHVRYELHFLWTCDTNIFVTTHS
ncbi:uncharacterized protein LOC128200291 [Galleria mellonella]|uniref:Uncharacterized protein LOC128200291 n=1 Tax=Galleria mellonella TaxID=7137 RepID=A0ABM3MD30_GALME|nr:uncharacterized protein LOC128200291 [Galleria mellonella]